MDTGLRSLIEAIKNIESERQLQAYLAVLCALVMFGSLALTPTLTPVEAINTVLSVIFALAALVFVGVLLVLIVKMGPRTSEME